MSFLYIILSDCYSAFIGMPLFFFRHSRITILCPLNVPFFSLSSLVQFLFRFDGLCPSHLRRYLLHECMRAIVKLDVYIRLDQSIHDRFSQMAKNCDMSQPSSHINVYPYLLIFLHIYLLSIENLLIMPREIVKLLSLLFFILFKRFFWSS